MLPVSSLGASGRAQAAEWPAAAWPMPAQDNSSLLQVWRKTWAPNSAR